MKPANDNSPPPRERRRAGIGLGLPMPLAIYVWALSGAMYAGMALGVVSLVRAALRFVVC